VGVLGLFRIFRTERMYFGSILEVKSQDVAGKKRPMMGRPAPKNDFEKAGKGPRSLEEFT